MFLSSVINRFINYYGIKKILLILTIKIFYKNKIFAVLHFPIFFVVKNN